ncbi:conserved hypothetical protein [Trichinella spiralis]|uniref:hypothetical protein n=1 Tax=Trichinella spiralis TaxID=6334 RepID=UPI0001EFE6BA|nr:conserved hypothetical protein [Trichinella spiralis]
MKEANSAIFRSNWKAAVNANGKVATQQSKNVDGVRRRRRRRRRKKAKESKSKRFQSGTCSSWIRKHNLHLASPVKLISLVVPASCKRVEANASERRPVVAGCLPFSGLT